MEVLVYFYVPVVILYYVSFTDEYMTPFSSFDWIVCKIGQTEYLQMNGMQITFDPVAKMNRDRNRLLKGG